MLAKYKKNVKNIKSGKNKKSKNVFFYIYAIKGVYNI